MATPSLIQNQPPKSFHDSTMIFGKENQCTSAQKHGPTTFTTIPTEVRLEIYHILVETSTRSVLRRRDGVDDEKLLQDLSRTFNTGLLTTCHRIYEEFLPIFYGSQTFHCSSTTGGLFKNETCVDRFSYAEIREGPQPLFSDNLHHMAHLSLGIEIYSAHLDRVDEVLSGQIDFFMKQCPKLRTFTVHLLYDWSYNSLDSRLTRDSMTASILYQLRSRLDRLSIVGLGPYYILEDLRIGVTDKNEVTEKNEWCYERLSAWPHLSLPLMQVQHIERSQTPRERFAHLYRLGEYICAWHRFRPGLVKKMRKFDESDELRIWDIA
ncbi:hypothetical protein MMC28_006492 [Mycoblastus sanguinarius]|nr:hypothetical protein [Mycoblastus sanguinarius]